MTEAPAYSNSQRIADLYGVHEENGLVDPDAYHKSRENSEFMGLAGLAAKGGKVTRLRLLTEKGPGYRIWDVSYCHGELPDGTPVHVYGGPLCMPGNRSMVKRELVQWAKSEGVYAKGLGLLDEANWSVLY